MKKILFIIGVLDSGGVAKSIVNLLNAIDRKEQEVHLLVMSAGEGPFARYIPKDVTIHRNPVTAWLLAGFGGVWQLMMHGHLLLAMGSLFRMALSRIDKPSAAWLLAQMFPPLNPNECSRCSTGLRAEVNSTGTDSRPFQDPHVLYTSQFWDTIVDFNGQQNLYYMVDKLKSKRKVTFFHNDYYKWRYYERMDRRYFKKVDNVYSISEQCVQSLKEIFPEVEEKIGLVYNVSLPDMIYRMAKEPVTIPDHRGALLVTVGHVCERKGIDFAIDAAHRMNKKGIDFLWLWIGSYSNPKYELRIKEMGLERVFRLYGICSNPYPFMKQADIIVHPSRYEGKSMTLDEAKILCKPIVVTNFSTVHDQFEDGVNAVIVEQIGKDLADAIVHLIQNKELQKKYIDYLRCHPVDDNYNVDNYENIL